MKRKTIPQIIRYQKINSLLNVVNNARVPIKKLIAACASSKRTIERDIANMRLDFDAPIKCDQAGYYYSEPFDMPQTLALSQHDLNKLKLAVETLNQFKDLAMFEDIKTVFEKIERSVKFKTTERSRGKYIVFEKAPSYKGTEHIDFFLTAIENTQVVSFNYHSYHNNTIKHHVIHPYVIKEHTNRWYIIGYRPKSDGITTYALDRIIGNLKYEDDYYKMPIPAFDVDDYLKNVVGLTVKNAQPIQEVILHFTSPQSLYFESKPFHQFEKVYENETGLRIKMNLILNYELVRKLATYGKGVTVIAPQQLIDDFKKFLKKTLDNYK